MNALIIEDEKAAVRNLTALLSEAAPHIGVVAVLDSIAESIDWFCANAMPDLIFLDIHLADGSAFEILNMWISPVRSFSRRPTMSMPCVPSK